MCCADAMSLSKSRPKGESANIITNAHSFACFLRGWKAIQAFRAEIIALVTRRLIIKHEPRPQENIDKTNRLVKLLYGDAESKWLQKRDKQGNLRKSRLLADLESLAEMVDLGLGTLDVCCHQETVGGALIENLIKS